SRSRAHLARRGAQRGSRAASANVLYGRQRDAGHRSRIRSAALAMLTNLPLTPLGTGSLPAAAGALVAGDGVQKRLDAVQPGGDELGDVQHLGGPFGLRSLARAEHDLAERAARGDDLGAGLHCLREALLRDPPVTGLLLLPELRATGAAAEGVVAALLHLEQVRAAPAEDRARRVVLAVVPAQVAGVVERDA